MDNNMEKNVYDLIDKISSDNKTCQDPQMITALRELLQGYSQYQLSKRNFLSNNGSLTIFER